MEKKCDWAQTSGDFLIMVFGLKKCTDMALDLPVVKKNKESWASSSCSTEEEMKAKCCSLSFPCSSRRESTVHVGGCVPHSHGCRALDLQSSGKSSSEQVEEQ